MIQSLWQIDLINASGTTRLLDYGDLISEEIKFSVSQESSRYTPIGSAWGETVSGDSAFVQLGWERAQNHASHIAARTQCLRSAAATATRKTGTLRISVEGGEVWDIADATIISSSPVPLVGNGFRTLTAHQAIGGKMSPAAAIALAAGMQWDWIFQEWEDVTNQWQTL